MQDDIVDLRKELKVELFIIGCSFFLGLILFGFWIPVMVHFAWVPILFYNRKYKRVYFSSEGIFFETRTKKVKIKWEDARKISYYKMKRKIIIEGHDSKINISTEFTPSIKLLVALDEYDLPDCELSENIPIAVKEYKAWQKREEEKKQRIEQARRRKEERRK